MQSKFGEGFNDICAYVKFTCYGKQSAILNFS